MPFVPVPNTARVEMIFNSTGQIVENVYHVEKADVWDVDDLSAINAAFTSWWRDNVRPLTAGTVTLQRVESRDLSSEAAPFLSTQCLANCSGGGGSPQLPNNVTVALKWTSGLTGRSQRGRTYHIGLMEGQVVADVLDEPTRVALASAYEELIGVVNGSVPGATLVVVSYVSNGVPRSTGQTTPIIAASLDGVVDSQRRRLSGRGS